MENEANSYRILKRNEPEPHREDAGDHDDYISDDDVFDDRFYKDVSENSDDHSEADSISSGNSDGTVREGMNADIMQDPGYQSTAKIRPDDPTLKWQLVRIDLKQDWDRADQRSAQILQNVTNEWKEVAKACGKRRELRKRLEEMLDEIEERLIQIPVEEGKISRENVLMACQEVRRRTVEIETEVEEKFVQIQPEIRNDEVEEIEATLAEMQRDIPKEAEVQSADGISSCRLLKGVTDWFKNIGRGMSRLFKRKSAGYEVNQPEPVILIGVRSFQEGEEQIGLG